MNVKHLTASADNQRLIYILAAGFVVTSAAGNCLLRFALESVGDIFSVEPLTYTYALLNGWFILGLVLLGACFVLQLWLLSRADLTYVLPITSLSNVLIALIGAFLLHEKVSLYHWCGIGLIAAGVSIVGQPKSITSRVGRFL
jgi:drug/metabolite transporter (DMT)-like permease